jgi:hypothetical protein
MSETLIATEEEQAELPDADAPCTAELAECTGPDAGERDHDNE